MGTELKMSLCVANLVTVKFTRQKYLYHDRCRFYSIKQRGKLAIPYLLLRLCCDTFAQIMHRNTVIPKIGVSLSSNTLKPGFRNYYRKYIDITFYINPFFIIYIVVLRTTACSLCTQNLKKKTDRKDLVLTRL